MSVASLSPVEATILVHQFDYGYTQPPWRCRCGYVYEHGRGASEEYARHLAAELAKVIRPRDDERVPLLTLCDGYVATFERVRDAILPDDGTISGTDRAQLLGVAAGVAETLVGLTR